MATLAPESPSSSPPFHRRRKSWARKVERCCTTTFSYFPLLFIYGLTSWAVWVEVNTSFIASNSWFSYLKAALGLVLYGIANVSYTIAVFTPAGSPLDARRDLSSKDGRNGIVAGGYEGLPTQEPRDEEAEAGEEPAHSNMTTVTAKSTGKPRYCKKCQTVKPDRTHHCSSCGQCVLKMDHHCPWLATCVGLRNYKPFLLFLIYISLFCWLCFAVSASWVWAAIIADSHMQEGMLVVNTILLAVLGGIIGLVLSGFTGWHIYLAVTGQTTIESLEKTRYLSPLRKSMEQQFKANGERNYVGHDAETGENGSQEQSLLEHLKETHANALPGILRPEEGELSRSHSVSPAPPQHSSPSHTVGNDSPAKSSLRQSYASLEEQRERERYDAYLDEQDSEKLPNAFDNGWKRNLLHVFGRDPLYWGLPVTNTSGDGWMWDVSPKWTDARAEVQRQREQRQRENATWGEQSAGQRGNDFRWAPGQGFVNPHASYRGHQGQTDGAGGSNVPMQPLDRRKASPSGGVDDVDSYDTSSDEERQVRTQLPLRGSSTNWNDVPDEFLTPRANGNHRSRSRGRAKGD